MFSHPTIGTVGYGEEEAVETFGDVDVYSSSFRPMRNTISGNASRALMKILVDANSQKVIGMHMVGPDAGEIMQVCPHIASIYILPPTCVTLQLVSDIGFVLKK